MDKKRRRLQYKQHKKGGLRRWKQSLLVAAGLLWTCVGSAQTPHTLLWQISGNGLKKPSYLFGTMHILCADDARLSDSLRAIITRCDEVYFEVKLDMSIMSMLGMMKYMKMNDGKKLSDLISQKDYEKVKDYFVQRYPPMLFNMIENYKPMMISSLIEAEGMNCQKQDGMELMIMKELQNNDHDKPINGLETLEFQASLFDSIPYEEQARDLVNYVDSSEEYKKSSLELAEVYKQQDLDKIDSISRKGDAGMNKYMDLLLYDRNRKWAKELGGLLPQKSLLVAVGAAHLPGENGVINLLRRHGYMLTPITN
ncbi:MAG TPA: TraB/GumN family protein [Puia sp.]|jgi:hypothetical protein